MKRVLKWTVPIDDERHPIGRGTVVDVAQQGNAMEVQVWTEEQEDATTVEAQVYGTGHEFPNRGRAVGSVLSGPYVWHVVRFEP
jgi:hypothetical protein